MQHRQPIQTQLIQLALNFPVDACEQFTRISCIALQGQSAAFYLQNTANDTLWKLEGNSPEWFPPVLPPSALHLLQEALQQPLQMSWTQTEMFLTQTAQVCCVALQLPDGRTGGIFVLRNTTQEPTRLEASMALQVAQSLATGLSHRQHAQIPLEALQRALQFLQVSPDMMFTFDGHTISAVNPACLQILGYTPEEMVGRPYTDFIHPDDQQVTVTDHQKLLQGADMQHYRNRFIHKKGHAVWLEWKNTTLGNQVHAVARDIGKVMAGEQQLKTSQQFLERLAYTLPHLMYLVDIRTGDVNFSNRDFSELLGFTTREVLKMTPMARLASFHPDHQDAYQAFLRNRWNLQDGEVQHLEVQVKNREGEWRWISIRETVYRRDDRGEVQEVLVVPSDITERKAYEVLMQDLHECQQRFLNDATHELKAPLTSIQGNLDLLIRYPELAQEEQKDILLEAQHSASRLCRLVKDLLQLAQGKQDVRRDEEVNLTEVALTAWQEAERLSHQHIFQLGVMESVEVLGDADRLRQLCLILLENAIKYTPAGGKVSLAVQYSGDHGVVSVKDTGVGIAEEHQQKIFERFFRVQARKEGDPGGNGLGLSIAHWIVEAHEGQIEVESTPGMGTTFRVHLPVLQDLITD